MTVSCVHCGGTVSLLSNGLRKDYCPGWVVKRVLLSDGIAPCVMYFLMGSKAYVAEVMA